MKRIMTIAGVVAFLFATTFASPIPTRANTPFAVNSTVDEVDATPGDGLCVSTPSGQCTLRAAIMEANALAGVDTINLPAGVYTLAIPGINEDAAMSGDLDIRGDVTLTGALSSTTIIDGGNIDRVIEISGTVAVQIDHLTIQHGNSQTPLSQASGGGIRNNGANLYLANSTVVSNTAVRGGGIYNTGYLLVTDSSLQGNSSSSGDGGGGLYNAGVFEMIDSLVAGNTSTTGSGIFNFEFSTGWITHTLISGNGAGGGVVNSGGQLAIHSSTLISNSGNPGGAIHNRSGPFGTAGILTVTASLIQNNSVIGVYNTNSQVTIRNSTISNNAGTGLQSQLTSFTEPTVYLENVTLANNQSPNTTGGLKILGGVAHIRNSLIAYNTTAGSPSDCSGTITSYGYNLIQDTTNCTISGTTTGNLTGIDPLLGILQDNGGSTLTQALLVGSPAIDAGNPAGCAEAGGNPLTTDQRGVARPQGSACDMGAFERVQTCEDNGTPVNLPFKLYLPLIMRHSTIICP